MARKQNKINVERWIGRVILALITYRDRSVVRERAVESLEVPADVIDTVLEAADQRIALVANYDRLHELGIQVERLNRLYERASSSEDCATGAERTARLTEQRKIISDLSKLLDLAKLPSVESLGEAMALESERLAREHLEALELCEKNLPVEELARRVALAVIDSNGYANGTQQQREEVRSTARNNETAKSGDVTRRTRHCTASADKKPSKKSKLKK